MGLFDKLFGGTKKTSNEERPKNSSFTSSNKLIDENEFCKIIESSKGNTLDVIIKT